MTIRKRFSRPSMLAVPLAAAALAAGCGDDSSTESEEREAAASPQRAIAEIGEVRAGLAAGLGAYARGDAEQAERLVGDAYLEHFELVEAPLEERDGELNEELEELLSTEIREEMKEGAKPARVEALVEEARRELGEAERALGGQGES